MGAGTGAGTGAGMGAGGEGVMGVGMEVGWAGVASQPTCLQIYSICTNPIKQLSMVKMVHNIPATRDVHAPCVCSRNHWKLEKRTMRHCT